MDCNVGGLDRTARLVVGPLLVVVALVAFADYVSLGPVVTGVALAVGLVLGVTGAVQKCPLNAVFGVDTCQG